MCVSEKVQSFAYLVKILHLVGGKEVFLAGEYKYTWIKELTEYVAK